VKYQTIMCHLEEMYGLWDCLKAVTECTIITTDGREYTGRNLCSAIRRPEQCPREPGEGYEKCETVCKQLGHAEEVALKLALDDGSVDGATAILRGHTHYCKECQEALFDAGISSLRISHNTESGLDMDNG